MDVSIRINNNQDDIKKIRNILSESYMSKSDLSKIMNKNRDTVLRIINLMPDVYEDDQGLIHLNKNF